MRHLASIVAPLLLACGPSSTPRPDPTPVATDPSLASSPGAATDSTRESPEPINPHQIPLTPEAAAPAASGPAAPPAPLPPEDPRIALAAAASAAFDEARPVFQRHCARCHEPGQPRAKKGILKHFSMGESYTGHGDHSLTKELREVLGIGGGRASMPPDRPGAVQGDELAAIARWADAQDALDAAPTK